MAPLPKPEVIITHESDLDGLLSGALLQRLAQKLFGTDIPLEAYHYNFWKQRDLRERSAWVADFTFEPRLDKPDWVIIDHHVTETAPKNAMLIHDVNKSAGLLCYELCRQHGISSPALDRLAHLNNVADLFLEDDPDFEIAGDYANLVKIYQFWNLHTLIGGDIEKLLDHPLLEVMAVKRRIENPIGFEWSKSNITEISPTVGFMDTIVGNNNLIVHQLLEKQATKYPVASHAVPARERGFCQFSQPQHRGAQGGGKIPGRRPRQRRRCHPAQIRPEHFRRRGIPAASFESKKRDATNAA